MNCQTIILGTEIKLRIEMKPIGNITMENCDFILEAYSGNSKKRLILKKDSSAVILDPDSKGNAYIFLIDSNIIGPGNLKCKITLFVPDSDFYDYKRTEVSILNPNIVIKNEEVWGV